MTLMTLFRKKEFTPMEAEAEAQRAYELIQQAEKAPNLIERCLRLKDFKRLVQNSSQADIYNLSAISEVLSQYTMIKSTVRLEGLRVIEKDLSNLDEAIEERIVHIEEVTDGLVNKVQLHSYAKKLTYDERLADYQNISARLALISYNNTHNLGVDLQPALNSFVAIKRSCPDVPKVAVTDYVKNIVSKVVDKKEAPRELMPAEEIIYQSCRENDFFNLKYLMDNPRVLASDEGLDAFKVRARRVISNSKYFERTEEEKDSVKKYVKEFSKIKKDILPKQEKTLCEEQNQKYFAFESFCEKGDLEKAMDQAQGLLGMTATYSRMLEESPKELLPMIDQLLQENFKAGYYDLAAQSQEKKENEKKQAKSKQVKNVLHNEKNREYNIQLN